jgi:hypothetical protein
MLNLNHVLVGGGKSVTSSLTGRKLLINTDPTRFRVPASFTAAGVVAAEQALLAVLDAMPKQAERRRPETSVDWKVLQLVFTSRTPAALAETLDPVVAGLLAGRAPGRFGGMAPVAQSRGRLQGRGIEVRAVQVLTLLWRHGCLLAPLFEPRLGLFFGLRWLPYNSEAFYGSAANLLAAARKQKDDARLAKVEGCVSRLLLVVNGVQELGDVSEEVLRILAEASRVRDAETRTAVDALVPGLFEHSAGWGQKTFRVVCNEIASAQRAFYARQPEIAAKVPQTYAIVRPERVKARMRADVPRTRDQSFSWVSRDFPECSAWQPLLAEYLKTRSAILDLRPILSRLAICTRAIIVSASPPATPIDACRNPRHVAALIKAEIETRDAKPVTRNAIVNAARDFFHWVITAKALRADRTLDPALGNPADLLPNYGKHSRKAQTDRPRMPGWLMQKAVELLCGNDYEWARSRQVDYFEVVEDGEVRQVWSPVLAELTRLRFILPIRGTQARLLGSGEGDSWVWEPEDGSQDHTSSDDGVESRALTSGRWMRNASRWAPPVTEERALGFLRRIFDPEQGTWTNGLYISTNKTADRGKGFTDLGYEIPWVNAEILDCYTRVLRFQQRYNPAKEPKSRAELAMEATIINEEVKPLLPRMHYLFRDAAHSSSADEPVTGGRVQHFWNDLIAELERRCAADPDVPRNPDGSPLQLVERWSARKPTKVKYDPHSVRVTGITRLALGGCPVQVLMMLAGHATWIMTLYYVKMSPSEVRRALDEAEARLEELDAKDLEEALSSTDPEKLRALRFAMSDDGLEQLRDVDEALLASSDIGLCPNGATLCHIGGKPVSTAAAAAAVFGPVAGGATNCQSCRFLVSGPQYIGGVVARLNAQSVKVRAAGERLREMQDQRRALVAERRRAGDDVPASLLRRVRRAMTTVEAAEAHCEDMSERWQNLYRLFNRCLKALQELMRREDAGEPSSEARHLLVLNGTAADVQCALQRCTDVALWKRVCADAEVFDVDWTEAAAKFGMRIDHLLAQSGRPAVFAGLTDRERVAVGNAFARWLETRLGPAGADEIYEGRRTLAEAGLLDDLDMVLPHGGPRVPATTLLPTAQRFLPSVTA